MSRAAVRVAALAVALGTLAAIAGLSRLPWTVGRSEDAVLRLSWRYQPDRNEHCQRPTDEELAARPVHMRNPDACVPIAIPYRVRLVLDGVRALDEIVEGAGARHDRPLFVFREFALEPGLHTIAVTFAPEPAATGDDLSRPGVGADSTPAMEAPALSWQDTVRLEPREAIVITYDRERHALEGITRGGRARQTSRP